MILLCLVLLCTGTESTFDLGNNIPYQEQHKHNRKPPRNRKERRASRYF